MAIFSLLSFSLPKQSFCGRWHFTVCSSERRKTHLFFSSSVRHTGCGHYGSSPVGCLKEEEEEGVSIHPSCEMTGETVLHGRFFLQKIEHLDKMSAEKRKIDIFIVILIMGTGNCLHSVYLSMLYHCIIPCYVQQRRGNETLQ